MTEKTLQDVATEASIRRTYVEEEVSDDEHIGWVESEIKDFEINEEEGKLDIIIEHPWGEAHRFGYDLDDLWTSGFTNLPEEYGYDVADYQRMPGEKVWTVLKSVDVSEDNIETRAYITYNRLKYGPHTNKYRKEWLRNALGRLKSWQAAGVAVLMAALFIVAMLL